MANNKEIKDALGVNFITKTTEGAGAINVPHVNVDSSALPTGASTSALQTTGNTSVASIDTKTPTLGQKTSSGSSPVVIASDQSAVPVSATFTPPTLLSDVLSAAITTTATTAAIATGAGSSYTVSIPVAIVTGTNPTMDITVQESDDTGTNWFTVYSFPRITATGIYRSPALPLRGNRVRYVQTIGGTTPSFTRAIYRLVGNISPITAISQLIDRSIVLTTLNSVTPSLNVQGGQNLQLVVNIGTTTIAPILQLEGSDDNGSTWYAIGTPLTAVASSTVQFTLATMINAQLVRARVSTAGTTTVMGYVLIKGF